MVREHKIPGLFSDPGTGFEQDHNTEFELALRLQNNEPGDAGVLESMIERYGGEVFQFAVALLDKEKSQSLPEKQICNLAEDTFVAAMSKSDHFWGEQSIRDWLFSLTIDVHRAERRRRKLKQWMGKQAPYDHVWKKPYRHDLSSRDQSGLWKQLDFLANDQRLAIILYYLFEREVADIARLMNTSEERLAGKLYAAREQILLTYSDRIHTKYEGHVWMHRKIQAHLSGRLKNDLFAQEELQKHLDQCKACRIYYEELKELDAQLPRALQKRWSFQPLSAKETEEIKKAALAKLREKSPLRDLIQPLQKGAWIGLSILVFIGIAWAVTRSGYLVEEIDSIPGPPTPTAFPLPEPLSIPSFAETFDWQNAPPRSPDYMFNIDPSMSSDGRYIAFTHYEAVVNDESSNPMPQIILYDQVQDEYLAITAPLAEDGNTSWRYDLVNNEFVQSERLSTDWGYAADISANGRWIVFTSAEKIQEDNRNENCARYWGDGYDCPGVYLFDRETGQTIRIDRARNGDPADRSSSNPRISPDGRMIVFWSAANNLVSLDSNPCQQEYTDQDKCLDVFVFDRETEILTQIPIGRRTERFGGVSLEVSSQTGRVALNIHENDRIAEDLDLNNELEAFVYNLSSGEFHPLNLTSHGVPGNGKSYGAVLSANGRFAGFVSHASNLVQNDTNQIADIFIRDLDSGVTERVSPSNNTPQGSTYIPDVDYRWYSLVSISEDGRYIAYAIRITDLDEIPLSSCDVSSSDPCTSIQLYDRETNTTHNIAAPKEGRYFFSPNVTTDGRYISYLEAMQDCSSESIQRICGEIWLHDRHSQWTSAVSKGIFPPPEPHQLLQDPERIPEVSADLLISSNGELIATIYNARNRQPMINLWTVEDRIHKSFLPGETGETITAAVFSPDGQFIAAGLKDGSVDIWRLSDRHRAFQLKGQPGEVLSVLFSKDSKRLFVGSTRAVWVWELRDRTFHRIKALNFPLEDAIGLTFSPSGRYIALASGDGTIWMMNLSSGKIHSRLETTDRSPITLTFSPDGDKLAVGSADGNLQIWEIEPQTDDNLKITYLRTLKHLEQVKMIAFSPNGSMLASISLDGKLRLWNYLTASILDSYPDNSWEEVNTFALSMDGKTLISSSWTGPTHVFKYLNQVEQPRYFDRARSDELSLPLAFPPGLDSKNWQTPALNLYQADEILTSDLKVPTYLPPGFVFGGARVVRMDDAAWLQYHYRDKPDRPPQGTLYIFQGPQVAEISDMPLGASALVDKITVGVTTNSEIVRGDWNPSGRPTAGTNTNREGMVPMVWDSQAQSYRLRYQSGNRTIFLYYKQTMDGSNRYSYINKADLVAIAESLMSLDQTYKPKPVLLPYRVQEGETCTSIAVRFGTSVDSIVRENNLSENCDFIFTGQELTVPLTNERITLAERDLNCDGVTERVRIIPNPLSVDGNTVLGVFVETLSNLGFYQEAWQYTLAEAQADLFTYPELYKVNDCQEDLAINSLMYSSGETGFEIYRWQGETMLPVNDIETINSLH